MIRRCSIPLAVALIAAGGARAEERPLLAVLEFDAPDGKTSVDELQLLTDAYRAAVIEAVGDGFRVMTRDVAQELVPPERMKCLAGQCAAEIGRILQASHVLSGGLRRLEGEWVLTLEAYLSNGGRVLGAEQLVDPKLSALRRRVRAEGVALVRRWLKTGVEGAASPKAAAGERPSPVVVAPPTGAVCPNGMRLVPKSRFSMGAATGPISLANEAPAHSVAIRAFCLDKSEVTQADFARLMGFDPSRRKAPGLPVHGVTWNEALAYANRRSDAAGLPRAYGDEHGNPAWQRAGRGFRLPTEAEWEAAARADHLPDVPLAQRAWFDENSDRSLHPVAALRAGAAGFHDLLGNAAEWTWDAFAPYAPGAAADPAVDGAAGARVVRGGAFGVDETFVRPEARIGIAPDARRDFVGFRLACDAPARE